MTSQLVIFKAFLFIFFRPPNPRSEKKFPELTNKKIWPKYTALYLCIGGHLDRMGFEDFSSPDLDLTTCSFHYIISKMTIFF